MNKKMLIIIMGVFFTTLLLTGCTAENNMQEAEKLTSNLSVKKEEDTQIKKLISDYFVKMYSESVSKYQKNSETGSIPDSLRTFLAKRTIDEGNNNIEIGLNFPRYVGINGVTLISYTPLMEAGSKDKPQIESTFIENNDGTLLYYSKVDLKAECVPDELFEANYKLNAAANTYQKTNNISGDIIDKIIVQTKYDVELVKDGNDYKILRAIESTYKQGAKNRLFRYNNDFITRLSYLNINKTADKKDYINKEDGAIFDKEKATITSFLNNISNLDSERRTLLRGSWDKGFFDFKKSIEVIAVDKDKDSNNILTIGQDFKEKFPKQALMLINDINKVKVKDNYKISLHPAYSELNKWYIITFNALVEKTNGVLENEQVYSFDYLIKMTDRDDKLSIVSVKLNNMSVVLKKVTDKTESNKKTTEQKTTNKTSEIN